MVIEFEEVRPDVAQPETEPQVNLHAYGSLAGEILGIPRRSAEWSRIGKLTDPELPTRVLADAVDVSLSQLRPDRANMLRRRFGLDTPGENGLSYQELAPFVGNYTTTTVRLMVERAVRSLRIPERLDSLNRVVYPERYSE